MLVLFALLYLPAYLPGDPVASGRALALPFTHFAILSQNLPRILFLLWFIRRSGDSAACGLDSPGRGRLAAAAGSALFAAAGALLLGLLARQAALAFGGAEEAASPLVAALEAMPRPDPGLIPLVLASSFSIGYAEELFFRSYLMKRLGDWGLSPGGSALASALLFGSAHGLQGLAGLLGASLLGAWFAGLRLRGAGIHALGGGHALYDAAVLLGSLCR